MTTKDRVLQLVELALLCLCLIILQLFSIKAKNLENELRAENAALRYEVRESEERCRRLSYTCIDMVNRKILEGENYGGFNERETHGE